MKRPLGPRPTDREPPGSHPLQSAAPPGPRASGPQHRQSAGREARGPVQGLVEVGVLGAPHGVKGEMRLKSFTADPLGIQDYQPLTDKTGQRRFVIRHARLIKDDILVVYLEGVADRTSAEALTNLMLFIPRDQLPEPDEEEFYHADLMGLVAHTPDGAVIGTVTAVHDFGAGDILEITPSTGPSLLVPFTKANVPEIDLAAHILTVILPDEIEGEERPSA
jgi:16S rRNA processing protein RimM